MRQIFYINWIRRAIVVIVIASLSSSCQKEVKVDAGTDPGITSQKPKVGTVWTYRYYIYNPPSGGNGIHSTETVQYKAKSEEILSGEKWLRIVNIATDTTIFLLNEKTGGLYQYANNSSNLFCKDPAAVGDTYSSFNDKSMEDFTVKGVKDTLSTGIGDIPANYYEGVKIAKLIDQVWYNPNAWIVRRHFFLATSTPLGGLIYYRYSSLYLDKIEY